MTLLPPPIHRLSPIEQDKILSNQNYYYPQIASIMDKIILTDRQIEDFNLICYKFQTNSISLDSAVLKIRAGGFYDWVALAFIIYMFKLQGANSFQNVPLPHQDPFGWLNGKYDSMNAGPSGSRPMTCLKMEKLVEMPQQEYSAMRKSEKRQLADPKGRDRSINIEDFPQLDLRFSQVKYKTAKHGKDHDLPVDNNGNTPNTEANALSLRDSLVAMAHKENIVWYTDGQYQGGTERGCDSVNLFDADTNVIAVYQKQLDGSYLFLTTCTLSDTEKDHLKSTNGNFVTEKILEQQNRVSDITLRDNSQPNNP